LCANALPRCSASMRPMRSALPPGGHGTTIRTGLLGQPAGAGCAAVGVETPSEHARLTAIASNRRCTARLPFPGPLPGASVDGNEFCCKHSAPTRARQGEQAKMRVVDAIAQWFEVAGFKHYFGYAGGAVWPFLDALTDKPQIEGIQAKHESHAVHMADLYHRVGGRIAPVIVSKGPGLLNAVGACASAMHESSPVLIIAGGSTTHFLGKAGMQEIYYHGFEDATSIFRPVCKGTWMVVQPDTAIDVLKYALKAATSGRPGPVFVEVPYDVQLAPVEGEIEAPSARAPQLNRPRADAASVERIARMIAEAERPLLLAGGGVV